MAAGVRNIIGCDQTGALYRGRRENMNWVKDWYAQNTNPNEEHGTVHEVIKGADVFLGLSVPGVIDVEDVKNMAAKPIVFAMANPTPEIMPEDAAPYVAVMATGRSDYPNQINNVLCFPGIFRGALACRASRINEEMKLAAANAIAGIITTANYIPSTSCRQHMWRLRTSPASHGAETVDYNKHRHKNYFLVFLKHGSITARVVRPRNCLSVSRLEFSEPSKSLLQKAFLGLKPASSSSITAKRLALDFHHRSGSEKSADSRSVDGLDGVTQFFNPADPRSFFA